MDDKGRIDWLEKQGNGSALVHDDNKHWAFATDDTQNVIVGDEPEELVTNYYVPRSAFRKTIREAIDAAIECNGLFDD